jgi:hypothetical protein
MNTSGLPKDISESPWNLRGLGSLWEIMHYFKCGDLVKVIGYLKEMESAGDSVRLAAEQLAISGADSTKVLEFRKLTITDDIKKGYTSQLSEIATLCEKIELKASIVRCAFFLVSLNGNPTLENIGQEAKVLVEVMRGDLIDKRFVFVPSEKARILDRMEIEWSEIWAYIPQSKADSEEAVYCYALERNDACIFHSMRAAERGLRILAKAFNVKVRRSIEYSDWVDLLNAINAKVKQENQKPRGPKRQNKLEFYSKSADRCERMNNLWRREISHARKGVKYLDLDALAALSDAREFMDLVVKRIKERQANVSKRKHMLSQPPRSP